MSLISIINNKRYKISSSKIGANTNSPRLRCLREFSQGFTKMVTHLQQKEENNLNTRD